MNATRTRFVVGIGVIVAAVGYLVFSATGETKQYFYTVGEFQEVVGASASDGRDPTQMALRIMGHVQPGSIEREPAQAITRFLISDPKDPGRTLPVVYRKISVPDTFKDNAEAVVEGRYTADGVFEAEVLFAKCPSKYEARGSEHPGGAAPAAEHPESIPIGTRT